MKINHKNYEIEIKDDRSYSSKSSNNLINYKFEFSGGKIIENRVFTINKRGIVVRDKEGEHEMSSAILCENGGRTALTEDLFEIDKERLLICIGDKMYGLSIPTLEIIWFHELDYGTIHSVNPFDGDFVVHGNLGLIRLSLQGTIKWRFSGGGGVFIAGQERLRIFENHIELIDGNDKKYMIDALGNIMD